MKFHWVWFGTLLRSLRDWVNPIPLLAIALMLFFGWLMIFGDEGLLTLQRLRQTERESLKKEQELTHRLDRLHTEIELLKDPVYLEVLVRKELGYVKPGETVYQFPEAEEKTPHKEEAAHGQHPEYHGE